MINSNYVTEYINMIEKVGRLTNSFRGIIEKSTIDFKEHNLKLLHILVILRIGDDKITVKILQNIFFVNDISKLSLTLLLKNGFIKLEKRINYSGAFEMVSLTAKGKILKNQIKDNVLNKIQIIYDKSDIDFQKSFLLMHQIESFLRSAKLI